MIYILIAIGIIIIFSFSYFRQKQISDTTLNLQAKIKAPEKIPTLARNGIEYKVLQNDGKKIRLDATDWGSGELIWEYILSDAKQDATLEGDVQEQFVTDLYFDGEGKLNIVRGFLGDQLDPMTGKVLLQNVQYNNIGFRKDRREALRLAEQRLWIDVSPWNIRLYEYPIADLKPMTDKPNQWYIKYATRAIEMIVDIKTGEVVYYKDSSV